MPSVSKRIRNKKKKGRKWHHHNTSKKTPKLNKNYIYFAIIKQLNGKNMNKEYKYFRKSIINHVVKKYKHCHVQQMIEIDFCHAISILIVSDAYDSNKSHNITMQNAMVIASNDCFYDLLNKINKILKLSYQDIKYIMNKLKFNTKFNHIIKKPNIYLNKLSHKMTFTFYAITQRSDSKTYSFSKSQSFRLQNKLKKAIVIQYESCILNQDIKVLSPHISILIVFNCHNDIHQYQQPPTPYHIVVASSNSVKLSLMNWLCDSVKTKLSLSHQNLNDIINALYYTTKNNALKYQHLLKYHEQLSLYDDYKWKKHRLPFKQSVLLVFGYINMTIKSFPTIDYVPECINNLIIQFFYVNKIHEMSRYDAFIITSIKQQHLLASLPGDHSNRHNTLISKLEFKANGIYSFKFEIINWCRCGYYWDYGKLRIGIVESSKSMNIDIVNIGNSYSFSSAYYWNSRVKNNNIFEMIINLSYPQLSLMPIAWYLNGKCEAIKIFEFMNKKEIYFAFVTVDQIAYYRCNCNGATLEFLY